MKTVILWIYAGILTCCLVFLLVLVSNESELAKFQNSVSTFMQGEQVSSNDTKDNGAPPTYSAVAGNDISHQTQSESKQHTEKQNADKTFVISLTSVNLKMSHYLLEDLTSQGAQDTRLR
ncbi:hypothetical protein AMC75_04910 [Staphylococcus carnosus]|uniref:hypothetical protein n=1 Tax=Staphylococcus carnosus TaxID=1281 RepID=UPI0006ABD406|nr:hypothetical protein [Staphylococcus carnosus]KOR14209.1 hypothetical protein AMC75_04910 [Staphylococcus carnosus]